PPRKQEAGRPRHTAARAAGPLTPPMAARTLKLSPDDAVGTAARAVLSFHLRTFAHEEGRARTGDVEPVHQLRVAIRRVRAALRLLAPVLPSAPVAELRADLAWLGSEIGAVRDLDVLRLTLRAHARRLDQGLRAGVATLDATIHERRVAAHAGL